MYESILCLVSTWKSSRPRASERKLVVERCIPFVRQVMNAFYCVKYLHMNGETEGEEKYVWQESRVIFIYSENWENNRKPGLCAQLNGFDFTYFPIISPILNTSFYSKYANFMQNYFLQMNMDEYVTTFKRAGPTTDTTFFFIVLNVAYKVLHMSLQYTKIKLQYPIK